MLTLLDLTEQTAAALEFSQAGGKDWTEMDPHNAPLAIAERGDRLYVIGSEGVGYEVTEESPLEINFHGRKESSFSMFPVVAATLSPAEVRDLPTGEQVDLADHIRTFGGRLEDNFRLWYRTLTA